MPNIPCFKNVRDAWRKSLYCGLAFLLQIILFRGIFMKKLTIEMPLVSSCGASQCGYNVNQSCHAKAITVGDYLNPGCDTFLDANRHSTEIKRIAGVGACKIANCRFNDDFECTAEKIVVGQAKQKINCLTYIER